jgi:Fe-S cluster biogenesis protein NfuA
MFIQTESTPNPDALKFLPGQDISPSGPVFFENLEDSFRSDRSSDLATKLFQIEGIVAVFFGYNFITITKTNMYDWSVIKPEVLVTIMDHLTAGLPVMNNAGSTEFEEIDYGNLSSIEKEIISIIETRVRPSVALDGGDIIYHKFEDGVVYLKLRGSCSGCPSSTVTLKNGIESMLKHFVPEVTEVRALED